MEDRTPMYLMIIVGIVALVAVIFVLTHTLDSPSVAPSSDVGGSITANVVADSVSGIGNIDIGSVGKVFIALMLVGIAGYLYYKVE